MESAKIFLKDLINKSALKDNLFKRNLLKQYLQLMVLDFIYSHPKYSQLVFYGGSCLRHCFDLPRLSEDLDFVDLENKIQIDKLAEDLEKYFRKETDLELRTALQKSRIRLKFAVLQELELAGANESDLLFLKVELFKQFNFCKGYKLEVIPLFKFNKAVLVKTFDLSTLMATKIGAILYRKWEKTDKKGDVFIKVKGRDYFDLIWYLEKGVKPNIKCIKDVDDENKLKNRLLEIIAKVDTKSIRLDLESLMEDKNFLKNLSRNIKEILEREIETKL